MREEDWGLLKEANQHLNSLALQTKNGAKDYTPVHERVKAFRYVYPRGCIKTEIIGLADGICTMKAEVYDEEGHMLADGHAQEKESSSFINKTSYIENCETSAVGRALGKAGFGLENGFASYEEVANAIKQQEEDNGPVKISKEQWKTLNNLYSKDEINEMKKELNIANGQEMPMEYAIKKIEEYWAKSKKDLPDKDYY